MTIRLFDRFRTYEALDSRRVYRAHRSFSERGLSFYFNWKYLTAPGLANHFFTFREVLRVKTPGRQKLFLKSLRETPATYLS